MKKIIFVFSILLSGCISSKSSDNQVQSQSQASAIFGRVTMDQNCYGYAAKVGLFAQGQTQPIYYADLNNSGTYEFHVTPGNYTVVAETQMGCKGSTLVTAQPNTTQQVDIVAKLTSTTTGSLTGGVSGVSPGGINTGWQNPGYMPSLYSNSYGPPCAWDMMGCSSYYYPGYAGGVVGKPNIYFSSSKDINYSLKLQINSYNNLLAASPIHGMKGWAGEYKSSMMVEAGDKYSYLFYDMRIDVNQLQSEKGFCTEKEKLVDQMVEVLTQSGFKENEIKDFTIYWAKRMPNAKVSCVYVQSNQEIDRLVKYEIQPTPDLVTKVWFMIVPKVEVSQIKEVKKHLFTKWIGVPKTQYAQAEKQKRNVSSPNSFEVREWGVAFLFD